MAGTRKPAADLPPPGCEWDKDLLDAGLEGGLPPLFRMGLSALALAILGGAAVAAIPAGGPHPVGAVLALIAALPWTAWLVRDDGRGPTWAFALPVLVPLAALGAAHRFAPGLALGGDLAYHLVTFVLPLTVLLFAAFAVQRVWAGVAAAGYTAFAVPLAAGWALGGATPDAQATITWHLGYAFCAAAGYAVRLSYLSSRRVAQAREALAARAAAERRRAIAQDVHDVVAHTLAVTMLHVTAARMAVRRSPDDAEEALREAERHGRASLADIRRMVRLLRADDATAVDAPQPGLSDVEALVESYRAAGRRVDLSLSVAAHGASPSAELAVYRVLQEALANAARHGGGPASVALSAAGGRMSLVVDNPLGGAAPAEAASQGSGLLGMRERVSAAGGVIETGSRDGRWVVRAEVPCEVVSA
ncbi:histidine kinase [Spongiactinospora sp. TRM90649]|uniref:sensor histidine kinase n=1 Tax=Spongiactinospora sp. TRM90649 TaxID=3031114 RepID=UPI0023F6AFFD|nr:histidine kinase [Spongiactinospora sp. TRM90649]MDF5754019.1 histidine kinase [Spongiactinospora sp. TRM90649]